MRLKSNELEYLCAWAKDEKARDPYLLPAHQQQAAHKVQGQLLIRAIKAWARDAGRKDEDIFNLYANPSHAWPWSSEKEAEERLAGIVEGSLV
jgi:hypothetical protein